MEFQEPKNHFCSFCDFKSSERSKLEHHTRVHTREKPFNCDQCNRGFSSTTGLNRHVLIVHQELVGNGRGKVYECSLCPYVTYHRSNWKRHTKTHSEERSCQYPNCTYVAKSSQALRLHDIDNHKNEGKLLCHVPACGFRANAKKLMRQHSVTHSEYRQFACDFEGCTYRAKRKQALRDHKIGVHNFGYKPFVCSMCNYCTTSNSSLRRHLRYSHTEEKPVKCNISGCAFSCKIKSGLTKHVQRCHADKAFKCDFDGCLFSAATLYSLEEHKRRVHYEKFHNCPSCNYQAAYPSKLQTHISRRHKVSQRIPCPNKGCTFQAKHRKSLNHHMQNHKDNLVCLVEGCGHVSHSSSTRQRHMQLHDPTCRPFKCPLCPKYFLTKDRLPRHLRSHTQEKPFECPACNFGAGSKVQIIKHVQALHPTISSKFDEKFVCYHCHVNFGCAFGLAMHRTKLKTAVVVLTRLRLK